MRPRRVECEKLTTWVRHRKISEGPMSQNFVSIAHFEGDAQTLDQCEAALLVILKVALSARKSPWDRTRPLLLVRAKGRTKGIIHCKAYEEGAHRVPKEKLKKAERREQEGQPVV